MNPIKRGPSGPEQKPGRPEGIDLDEGSSGSIEDEMRQRGKSREETMDELVEQHDPRSSAEESEEI
ncbi:hypothetical protein [Polyangium aurulentum]|uniref:hypothetical protein n=1 Tax=Polyangium aurulentum TaxID=2567896 RepID=UPI0010AE004D|nr:hypothetical protein [Polyangium aurulentum]UQA62869.1 hypothetical protein E8A73_021415 [Polyangium aurulentum]